MGGHLVMARDFVMLAFYNGPSMLTVCYFIRPAILPKEPPILLNGLTLVMISDF
jgi:hypothetical protein